MLLLCLFLCYLSYTELIKGQMFDIAPPPLCCLWRSAFLLLSLTTYLKEWPENLSSETSQLTERGEDGLLQLLQLEQKRQEESPLGHCQIWSELISVLPGNRSRLYLHLNSRVSRMSRRSEALTGLCCTDFAGG